MSEKHTEDKLVMHFRTEKCTGTVRIYPDDSVSQAIVEIKRTLCINARDLGFLCKAFSFQYVGARSIVLDSFGAKKID